MRLVFDVKINRTNSWCQRLQNCAPLRSRELRLRPRGPAEYCLFACLAIMEEYKRLFEANHQIHCGSIALLTGKRLR